MKQGLRNKAKYPHTPGDYDNAQLKYAIDKAGTIAKGAEALKVGHSALNGAVRLRKIDVDVRRRGGVDSRYDWAKIECEWRARGPEMSATRFARDHGIDGQYFRSAAIKKGFYVSPISQELSLVPPSSTPGGKRIEDMTSEEKAKASAALDDILHYRMMGEIFCEEKRKHTAAMGQAGISSSSRVGAA